MRTMVLCFVAAISLGLVIPPACAVDLAAQWIWKERTDYSGYNDCIIAQKSFEASKVKSALIRITADTRYRLFINDEWVADGPCRSWPSHYHYDTIEVASHLRPGKNTIRILAKFYGAGTFQQVPQQAGLLVQLEAAPIAGDPIHVVSDASWHVADATACVKETLKRCVQMGPYEIYDARQEDALVFEPAAVLFPANDGPWQDLNSRDCRLLTREPVAFERFMSASIVAPDWLAFGFPTGRLLYPGRFDANRHVSTKSAVATVIHSEADMPVRFQNFEQGHYRFFVNGVEARDGECQLRPGENFFTAVIGSPFVAWQRDTIIRFVDTTGFSLRNPLDGTSDYPWCFVSFEEAEYATTDYEWGLLPEEEQRSIEQRIAQAGETYIKRAVDVASFKTHYGTAAIKLPAGAIMDDPHFQFQERRVLGPAANLIDAPAALTHDNQEHTVVHPSGDGDVELLYDLGVQRVGYYQFDLEAEPGLVVDVAGVEYIDPAGRVQHTGAYRNSMRYICKDGWNRFTSFDRRSGRYLFITFRNQTRPVTVRNFRVIESTYPVDYQGRFACSDETLTRTWEIAAHTLKMCMEDTFTDCPLYEQTHWVGDARNEALFAYTAFGAHDLARRCIRLTGESLEKYPIVLSQTPSGWERLLPAFSFLWVLSVWDYYHETGDKEFLAEAYPWVIQNLRGASQFEDERGLFSGPLWNFFDWTNIDQNHRTVLHNSMLLVAAIQAAERCGEALKDHQYADWLADYEAKLVQGLNALWDPQRRAYPDSVHNDGSISGSISIHTSILALLYDIVEEENRERVLHNILAPPDDMVRAGSPFVLFYQMEVLAKAGRQEDIIRLMYDNYQPMLDAGATTVWESFATGTTGRDGFPTRSHCHGWAAAPVYYLNRIVLGITPETVGGTAFVISPHLSELRWAEGATATVHGPVEVRWHVKENTLFVTTQAPDSVHLRFAPNRTHRDMTIIYNGEEVAR